MVSRGKLEELGPSYRWQGVSEESRLGSLIVLILHASVGWRADVRRLNNEQIMKRSENENEQETGDYVRLGQP
jgi:hypothetical protein